jgi:membrane protease subunit HflK
MNRDEFEFRREQIGPAAWLILGLIVAFVIAYLAMDGFYTVRENENAVVLRFGKYHSTTSPGFHLKLPLADEVIKVNVTEERRIRLPFGVSDERRDQFSEETTLMLTGDLNAASVEWTLQWRVQDPKQKVLSFYDPNNPESDAYLERVLIMAARSVMNRLVGDYSIDEVLTEKRPEIRLAARDATQETLDQYECGVIITDLQMQRVRPPSKVRPAFDAVNSAIQRRDQLENEANKERNKLIPVARADADKLVREAEGYAARRIAETQGEIKALRAKFKAYGEAPEVTRQRLYLEAMSNVLGNVDKKIIIDSKLQQVLPLLPLQKEASK